MRAIPDRETVQAVLMISTGLGWAVGIGGVLAGRIERDASAHLAEREARDVALALSDAHDLLVLRSDACDG